MSQQQTQGLGGLSYKSTSDLSGTVSDVTNGNAIGTTYKNGIGLAVIADVNNANSVVVATNGNELILGFLQNNPKAGEAAQIGSVRGASYNAVAGEAGTAINAKLVTDTYGRVVAAAAAGSGTAQVIIGIAMETPTAAGDLIEVVSISGYNKA